MKDWCAKACSAYLDAHRKAEQTDHGVLTGWYHFIEDTADHTVGAVATAQTLISIKECALTVPFDCKTILRSLLSMQNTDGSWNYRTNILDPATEPTAWSVQALLLWNDLLAGEAEEAIRGGVSWLLSSRNASGLWGPMKMQGGKDFVYFSCVALRCLHRFISSPAEAKGPLAEEAAEALKAGCASLLKAFREDHSQHGWGVQTECEHITLFHTAYAAITLLEIDPQNMEAYPVISSLTFLADYAANAGQKSRNGSRYLDGGHENYSSERKRLSLTHSVDTYVLLAALYGCSESERPGIVKKSQVYFDKARKTDWYYQDHATSWRLYDILYFCRKCTEFLDPGREEPPLHFKIALTFAGESRELVEEVAQKLADRFGKEAILYDKFHEALFARPQLDTYLQELYHDRSDLIVVFLCDPYSKKPWCGIEWRAVRDILIRCDYDKIMYVKVGPGDIKDIQLPGFYSSEDGVVDANDHSIQEIADLIIERYNSLRRS